MRLSLRVTHKNKINEEEIYIKKEKKDDSNGANQVNKFFKPESNNVVKTPTYIKSNYISNFWHNQNNDYKKNDKLLLQLKLKQNEDPWAKIIKTDVSQYEKEEEEKKNLNRKNKIEFYNRLKFQVEEKQKINDFNKDLKNKFSIAMKNSALEEDELNRIKELELKQKQKEEGQALIRLNEESIKLKKQNIEREKSIDKMVIDKIIDEEQKNKEQLKSKKKEMKKYFDELKNQNNTKIEDLNKLKLQQKIENKKFLENYENLLEQQDIRRTQEKAKRINQFQNNFERTNNSKNLILIEKAVKLNEILDKKFDKENRELNERLIKDEKDKEEKKREMIKDLRTTLEKQIKEKNELKKNLKDFIIEEKEKNEQIENNYKQKLKEDLIVKKLKVMNFKKSLDEQIKNKKNSDFMSENERKLNSFILRLSGEN